MGRPDDQEPSPEEARALLAKLLTEAGAEVDVEKEREEAARAASDAVETRPNAKPLLGFDARPNAPAPPAVGRGPRKKT